MLEMLIMYNLYALVVEIHDFYMYEGCSIKMCSNK